MKKKFTNKQITVKNCNNTFTGKNKKVAHHDHITGEFIFTLCNSCNLDFQYKKFLPV